MTQQEVGKLLEIGVMLSAEREPARLLDKILAAVMEVAHCDAGTLYLLDGDVLRFKIMRNHTMGTCAGGDGRDPDMPPVPLTRKNVCAYALLEGKTVNIGDVYECGEYDFAGPRIYDRQTGYRTQSMLAVPMVNRTGEGIGVLQLINALDEDGNVCPFAEDMALVLESVASQAAVAIQNVRYMRDIRALLDSIVQMMSSAIDERSPYNASHTRHMAASADAFMDFLNENGQEACGGPFTNARREELLMSVWLHDIGKVVTPLEVMDKALRLRPDQHERIVNRMKEIRLLGRIREAEGSLTKEEYGALCGRIDEAMELVDSTDGIGRVEESRLAQLDVLRKRTYIDLDGAEHPWLEQDEYDMLSIEKGTLSEDERRKMQEHVSVTDRLLSRIHFPAEFSHVRQWAASHHEYLNGLGYPAHLKGDEIPCEVRILTILDIFDALIADDRPYKPGLPVKKAVSIITGMAEKEGKLDPQLTKLFIESRSWEKAGYDFLDRAAGQEKAESPSR